MPAIEVRGRPGWFGTGGVDWREGQPALLMVHGAGMDHSVWALPARSLAQNDWNVAAVDLPGHGRSEDSDAIESLADYSAWLGAFAEAAGFASYGLVGHSMGACIAATHAQELKGRAIGVALLGAGDALPVNDALLDDTANNAPRAHRFIATFGHGRDALRGGAEIPGVWLLGAAVALLERCSPKVLHRDFAACNGWPGIGDVGIGAPTTVISGAGDRMTPPRAGRALADSISGATHTVLPGAGHMMMAEAPSAVNRALRAFFAPLGVATKEAAS